MRTPLLIAGLAVTVLTAACTANRGRVEHVRLMTLDPAHFHAALVQKAMYPQVDPVVHVYAPAGQDLDQHLGRIAGFNSRAASPTTWATEVHRSDDCLERMLAERPGNVVVIAGNNRRKTEYVSRCVEAGLNVLADKPMAIDPAGFTRLRGAFDTAQRQGVMLYDIMTERFEITAMLQRELSRQPALFGTLQTGSPERPAMVQESVHHLLKEVAGKPLIRPEWFFDIRQQGEALADVGTHLVDLAQWTCFPDVTLDWTRDIRVLSAKRWQTRITREDYQAITGAARFADYLAGDVGPDGALNMYANGEATYTLRGVHIRIAALWNVRPPAGSKDTHYSLLRGTRASLVVRQTAELNFVPSLFVEPADGVTVAAIEAPLREALAQLAGRFPGLGVAPSGTGWQVTIPASYHNGHEAHFAQVTERYLGFLAAGSMPEWEVPNMLAKYYTTTEAYRLSQTK